MRNEITIENWEIRFFYSMRNVGVLYLLEWTFVQRQKLVLYGGRSVGQLLYTYNKLNF